MEKLAKMGATHEEMAGFFGVSTDTIARRLKDDESIRAAYEAGFSDLRISLRRYQITAARNGNAAILIWLGKQLLGQSDSPEVASDDTQPLVIEFDGEDGDDD
ncbi:hypothetical protein D2T81_00815 [Azospirillum brasilense]|nr:hypothetical protein D2T81_00815 [Azospirillum brasilense]